MYGNNSLGATKEEEEQEEEQEEDGEDEEDDDDPDRADPGPTSAWRTLVYIAPAGASPSPRRASTVALPTRRGARAPSPPEHDEGPLMALRLPRCGRTTSEGSERSGAARSDRRIRGGVANDVARDALAAGARRGGVRGARGAWETTGRREMRPMAAPR